MSENEKIFQMMKDYAKRQDAAFEMMADVARQMAKDREQTKQKEAKFDFLKFILPWILAATIVISVCVTFYRMHTKTLDFFSLYDFSYEEINQDSAEGGGNNVYFPGENAQYNEAPPEGE